MRTIIKIAMLGLAFSACASIKADGKKEKTHTRKTLLSGYFIYFRDTIINKDADNIREPSSSFEFFVEDKGALTSLQDFNQLIKRGDVSLLSSISGGSIQLTTKTKRDLNSIMSPKYDFLDYVSYFPFNSQKIPSDTINTNLRFASIYKGQVEVYGPINTVEPFTYNQPMKGYIYLKSPENHLQYLYSVVLSGSKFIGFIEPEKRK